MLAFIAQDCLPLRSLYEFNICNLNLLVKHCRNVCHRPSENSEPFGMIGTSSQIVQTIWVRSKKWVKNRLEQTTSSHITWELGHFQTRCQACCQSSLPPTKVLEVFSRLIQDSRAGVSPVEY